MTRVVYSCPYVPAEWIAAHGLSPVRVMPVTSSVGGPVELREGMCPFVRAFLNTACCDPEASGVVVTTVCDQMRRGADVVETVCSRPAFVMNVPATWQTLQAQGLYVSELKRLGGFLEKLGGAAPSAGVLSETMTAYDEKRSRLQSASASMSPREFSEAIAGFHAAGMVPETDDGVRSGGGIPVALLGGPMTASAFGLFDLIEESGGQVVLDGTETGERTMPRAFNRRRIKDDPLLELTDAYFGSIPDASRRPNSQLYAWLKDQVAGRGICGIILVRHLWCDIWHGEVQRLRDWLEIPLLDVDMSGEDPAGSNRTRVQAFMEALS